MKRKEMKNIAKKVAEAEYIVETSDDEVAIAKAQAEIMRLAGFASRVEELDEIDSMVREILRKEYKI